MTALSDTITNSTDSSLSTSAKHVDTVDVVIVGLGAAGATAAIEARTHGASVLILDRAPLEHIGGSSRVSAQGFIAMNDPLAGAEYLSALSSDHASDPDRLRAWAQASGQTLRWLTKLGATCRALDVAGVHAEYPELPGATSVTKFRVTDSPAGPGLWNLLTHRILSLGIPIRSESRVIDLIVERCGRVSGVRAMQNDGSILPIRTRFGVVLACGGYAASPKWLESTRVYAGARSAGSPYSTGDGLDLAQSVGASIQGIGSITGPYLSYAPPGFFGVVPIEPLLTRTNKPGGFIAVARDGRRFMDELRDSRHGRVDYDGRWDVCELPHRAYLLMEREILSQGPLVSTAVDSGWARKIEGLRWSADNTKELAAGWIAQGDTIAEISKVLGTCAATLQHTVDRWNRACASGRDTEWGRTRRLNPIGGGPYYAVKLVHSLLNSQGGPRRDASGRILHEDGSVIPGLFGAGELGSVFDGLYQGSGNLADCLISGRAAGLAIARPPIPANLPNRGG